MAQGLQVIPQLFFSWAVASNPSKDKNKTRLDYCYALIALWEIVYASEENTTICFGWLPNDGNDGDSIADDWWQPAAILGRHIYKFKSSEDRDIVAKDVVAARRRGQSWEAIAEPYALSLPNVEHFGRCPEPMVFEMSNLEVNDNYNLRAAHSQDVVDRYAELVKKHGIDAFDDPCEVYWVDNRMILVEGFRRIRATIQAGHNEIWAHITYGTARDAVKAALIAESRRRAEVTDDEPTDEQLPCTSSMKTQQRLVSKPGTETGVSNKRVNKLTGAENRQRILSAIAANPSASDREIGRLIGCDHKTVAAARQKGIEAERIETAISVPCVDAPIVDESHVENFDNAQNIIDGLQRLQKRIQAIERTGDDAAKIAAAAAVNQFHAAACSHLCDMNPLEAEDVPKKRSGVLFGDDFSDLRKA